MSIARSDVLYLGLPADGDQSWGAAMRQNIQVLEALAAPTNCYFVSPQFTDANLHAASATAPRFFSTLQAAHDAVTTGSGWDKRAVIYVYPGQYQENLVLTKTCAFISMVPAWYRALGAMRGAELLGSYSVQSPLIIVAPNNSTEVNVAFVGFMMENLYSATTSGNIANALIARVLPQGTYGARSNVLSFSDCEIRMQCYGSANDWQSGIWVAGWSGLGLRNCNVKSGVYGAGNNNAGVQNMFYCRGNNANGKACSVQVINSRIAHAYWGTVAATPSVFNMDDAAVGEAAQSVVKACTTLSGESRVNGVTKTIGATGSPLMTGVVAGDNAAYGNVLGVDVTGL